MAQMHGISTSPLMEIEIKWEGKLISLSGGGLSNIFSHFKGVGKKDRFLVMFKRDM